MAVEDATPAGDRAGRSVGRTIAVALGVCLLGGLALAGVLLVASTRDEPGSTGGQPRLEASAVSPTELRVTWSAPEDAHRWWVILTDGTDRSVGQRTACAECRSITVGHLAPGSEYGIRVVGVGADGGFGAFSDKVTARTSSPEECAGVAADATCVMVGAEPVGDAPGTGLGSLHGITANTDPAMVTPLEPTAWRLAALDFERFRLARQYGGTITVFLSDPWMNTFDRKAPWADWDAYRAWVVGVVDAHVANGALPDYWEVQNEPAAEAYADADPATPDLVWEQHRVAAEAIHSRLPDAAVIGPAPGYPTFGTGLGDLEAFLDHAEATPGTIAGISWHEIGAGCLGFCDGSPRAVLQHADDLRAAMAEHPGAGELELHVNEWGAPWNIRQPGAIVGYLSSLAYGGIDHANPTCWHVAPPIEEQATCFGDPGTMTGLLLADGRTPTDAWWTHAGYAAMTGPGFELLPSDIADPDASVVATRDASGTIRLAIGRHTGCDKDIDAHCPDLEYGPDATLQPVVSVPSPSGRFSITTVAVPSADGEIPAPVPSASRIVETGDGVLDLGPIELPDGDAVFVVITPV